MFAILPNKYVNRLHSKTHDCFNSLVNSALD